MIYRLSARGISQQIQSFQNVISYSLITQKLYFGQGGTLNFHLLKRLYDFRIQTFWEDHCEIQIEGLTGSPNFTLYEDSNQAFFNDHHLQKKMEEKIRINMKIPQDYTLDGAINGNLSHEKSAVGARIRSNPFSIKMLGKNNFLQLGGVECEDIRVENEEGKTVIDSLVCSRGKIVSKDFESAKIMISNLFQLQSTDSIKIRSLIMFKESQSKIQGQDVYIESYSGRAQIQASSLRIDRIYAGQSNIDIQIQSQVNQKLVVEAGTGKIQFKDRESAASNFQKVLLGKTHLGAKLFQQSVILIQEHDLLQTP